MIGCNYSFTDYTAHAELTAVFIITASVTVFSSDNIMSAAVYHGNTRVSATLQYSGAAYGNGKTGQLLTVCKALFAYSDSAKAYS